MSNDTREVPHALEIGQQLCFMLHRSTARFIGRWDRFLRQYNLTFSEYLVLLATWERSPVSESAIAMRLQFDPYTLEDAIVGLERSRLVVRSDDHGMPAQRVVEATREGLDLQPRVQAIRDQFHCDLGLSARDAGLLMTQLEKVSDALTAMDADLADQERHII